jgi:hypothetical protein
MLEALLGFGLVAAGIVAAESMRGDDVLKGGLADQKRPSDFDPVQLRRGVKVEREHSSNPGIQREIAMDHLTEDERYYIELDKMERKLERTRRKNHRRNKNR